MHNWTVTNTRQWLCARGFNDPKFMYQILTRKIDGQKFLTLNPTQIKFLTRKVIIPNFTDHLMTCILKQQRKAKKCLVTRILKHQSKVKVVRTHAARTVTNVSKKLSSKRPRVLDCEKHLIAILSNSFNFVWHLILMFFDLQNLHLCFYVNHVNFYLIRLVNHSPYKHQVIFATKLTSFQRHHSTHHCVITCDFNIKLVLKVI